MQSFATPLRPWDNTWPKLYNLNLASSKERLCTFVRFMPILHNQSLKQCRCEGNGRTNDPPNTQLHIVSAKAHILLPSLLYICRFEMTFKAWGMNLWAYFFGTFLCIEVWIAEQATWDLGHVLAMCQSMEKIPLSITWPWWRLDGNRCNIVLSNFGVLKLTLSGWQDSSGDLNSSKKLHLINLKHSSPSKMGEPIMELRCIIV
jgi:hypothetical protein